VRDGNQKLRGSKPATNLTKVIQLVPLDKRNLKGYTSVSDQKLWAQRA